MIIEPITKHTRYTERALLNQSDQIYHCAQALTNNTRASGATCTSMEARGTAWKSFKLRIICDEKRIHNDTE